MNYIINKHEITFDDLHDLINLKAERSVNLEFKDFADINIFDEKKQNKLSVLVSAMANTGGGIIFFGIKTKRKKANQIIAGNINGLTCDKIKTVLNLKINKPVKNLKIGKINLNNKFVFYINIPYNNDAPHIAHDYRYYKRTNLRISLMEENEIRAKYNKQKITEIEFFGILDTSGVPTLNNGQIEVINFFPKFLIKNNSNVIEKFYKVELFIPSSLHDADFNLLQNKFSRLHNKYSVFSESPRQALFQNEIATVLPAKIKVTKENFKDFDTENIIIKVYYSNGIKEHYLRIRDTFIYNKKRLIIDDFLKKQTISNNKPNYLSL